MFSVTKRRENCMISSDTRPLTEAHREQAHRAALTKARSRVVSAALAVLEAARTAQTEAIRNTISAAMIWTIS